MSKLKNWLTDTTIDDKIHHKEPTVEDPTTGILLNLEDQKVIIIKARLLFERDKTLTPIGGSSSHPSFFTTLEKSFATNQLAKDGRECKHRYLFIENIDLFDKDGKTPLPSYPFQGYEVLVGKNMVDLAVKNNGGEKPDE